MGLLDLSSVTRVLLRLLREAIRVSPAWDGSLPEVSPLPPDKLGEAGDVLGFYLYHVGEDSHFRSAPPAGSGPAPVALSPMGLILHYQLTAHTTASVAAPDGAYQSQLLFGLALKALHDNATVSDATSVNGVPLLSSYGLSERENRLRLTLRPVPVEEAVTYWTAGQGPARLAAYYQVSVVMLEPDRPAARTSLTLERSVSVFPSGPPHLSGSENTISFIAPGAAAARSVLVSPAQVPLSGRFRLLGSDLAGDGSSIVLESRSWSAPEELEPIAAGLVVGQADVTATLTPSAGSRALIPGVYSVAVRVRRLSADGRAIFQTSNWTAMLITPEVSEPGAQAPGGSVALTGSLFAHADIPEDVDDARAVQIIVGAFRLTKVPPGPLAPGEFQVNDAHTLTLRVPLGLAPGYAPLRVIVNGAESPPRWLRVTP